MIRVALSESADADLESILDYGITAHGRAKAEYYLQTINMTATRLAEFPALGAARDDLRPGLRSLPSGEHRLYYRVDPEEVVILRVLHKAMDPDRHL